jgi:predicted RNA methylase
MFSKGFIFRWGVRIKDFGERIGHIRIFNKFIFNGLSGLIVTTGLTIKLSALKERKKNKRESENMKNVEQDVLKILINSKIEDKVLYLPPEKLERKLYEKVNMVLSQIGGKWNRKQGGHVFEDDPADAIDEILLTGQVLDKKKEFQFFPTPKKIAEEICDMADINKKCDCLEPSAGTGNIADIIMSYSPKSLTVVELDETNDRYLKNKYTQCFIGQDFLTWETKNRFDRILMNPPFSKKQDIKHILRAWELLKSKGILVSILSPSPFFCNDKLSQNFMEFLNKNNAEIKDFNEGEFKESGTAIRTKCIKVIKNA